MGRANIGVHEISGEPCHGATHGPQLINLLILAPDTSFIQKGKAALRGHFENTCWFLVGSFSKRR